MFNFSIKKPTKKTESVKEKILLNLLINLLIMVGNYIHIPYVNYELVQKIDSNSWINYLFDSSLGFFHLGISSYINASLIMQFLMPIVPYFEKLKEDEGEAGREKIAQITKLLSLVFSVIQAGKIILNLRPYIFNWTTFVSIKLVFFLVTGAMIMLWFGDLLSEKGFGNGTSLIICMSLFERFPIVTKEIFYKFSNVDNLGITQFLFIFIFFAIVALILAFHSSVKEIDLLSSKQFTSKFLENEKYSLPFRLNQAGVMALVFTSTFTYIIGSSISKLPIGNFTNQINPLVFSLFYTLFSGILIVFFNYYYSTIFIDRKKLADELRKMSVTIPKVQPGKPTAKYLKKILTRIYILGGICLASIVVISDLISLYSKNLSLRTIGISSLFILIGTLNDCFYKYEEFRNSPKLEESELLK
jgi:preprotein translocase subunit SecY